MENKAAMLVSSLIAGTRCKNVVIAGKAYTIKSPTLKILCRTIGEFAQCGVDESMKVGELFNGTPDMVRHLVRGLAYAIVGDDDDFEKKTDRLTDKLLSGSPEEIASAVDALMEMSSLNEVFRLAASATKYAEAAAQTK